MHSATDNSNTAFQVAFGREVQLIELQGAGQVGAGFEAIGGDVLTTTQIIALPVN